MGLLPKCNFGLVRALLSPSVKWGYYNMLTARPTVPGEGVGISK